jgi:hypothetical protein
MWRGKKRDDSKVLQLGNYYRTMALIEIEKLKGTITRERKSGVKTD